MERFTLWFPYLKHLHKKVIGCSENLMGAGRKANCSIYHILIISRLSKTSCHPNGCLVACQKDGEFEVVRHYPICIAMWLVLSCQVLWHSALCLCAACHSENHHIRQDLHDSVHQNEQTWKRYRLHWQTKKPLFEWTGFHYSTALFKCRLRQGIFLCCNLIWRTCSLHFQACSIE